MSRRPLSTGLLEFSALHDVSEQRRLNQYATFWDFYKGHQWPIPREEGENQITLNYCKAIVDKSVAFLFGQRVRIIPHKEVSDVIKPILDEVFDYNNCELLGLEMGQMGAITGDCFVKVAWEDPKTDEEGNLIDEEYPEGKVRISVIPSSYVFPKYDSHDKDNMISCTIEYAIVDLVGGKPVGRIYREEVTPTKIRYYLDGTLVEEKDNPLRQINIVHIKNLPLAGECYGQSDLASLISLQRELNEKNTDVSDIINYHSAPITIIQGAKAKDLERGARKVWGGIPKDAKIYNLELHSDLNASNHFIDRIKTAIHELSNTPEDTLGKSAAISNTTGVALQIKYSPLMEKTWIKRQTYGKGIREICKLILKLLRIAGSEEVKAKLEPLMSDKEMLKKVFKITVKFPDPLPKDELVQLQKIAQKMNLGLEEPYGALQELGYEGDIEEKLERIREYQREQQNLMFDLAGQDIDLAGIATQYDSTPEE